MNVKQAAYKMLSLAQIAFAVLEQPYRDTFVQAGKILDFVVSEIEKRCADIAKKAG